MSRSRSLRARSVLATLLSLCLLASSFWSVSAEAMEDAMADEAGLFDIGGAKGHAPISKSCNHGCHAHSQLTGLSRMLEPLSAPEAKEAPPGGGPVAVLRLARDGPFHPPRIRIQA